MNAVTKLPVLPNADFNLEVEAGGIKKVKSEHRRSDAMSFVSPDEIKVIPGFNVRIRDEAFDARVRSLADDMKAHGFKIDRPLTVFVRKAEDGTDEICVTDGHTRLEGVRLANSEGAGIETIPVVILPKGVNMADLTVDLIRSNSGTQLSTYECAIVVKRLLNMEFTEEEIEQRLQLTKTTIANYVILAGAPKAVANLVVSGKISATTAIEAIRKHGNARAVEILKAAVEAAAGSGKGKVTPAALPGARFQKTLKKSAPKLYESARKVQQDPAYASLSPETRQALDELLAQLEEQDAPSADSAERGAA